MARESSLWKWLSKARKLLKSTLHMHRVENVVMSGMPDVEGFVDLVDGHGQFWIELKSSERPVRPTTPIRFKVKGREAQIEWLTKRWNMGGYAWLLLQVGSGASSRKYLVPGKHSKEIYTGVIEERIAELDVLRNPKVKAVEVIMLAVTSP